MNNGNHERNLFLYGEVSECMGGRHCVEASRNLCCPDSTLSDDKKWFLRIFSRSVSAALTINADSER